MSDHRVGYKRAYDLSLTLATLPFWLTLGIAVALAVCLVDGRPVFYTQRRFGRGGRLFTIIKFRTMIRDAEAQTGPVWAVPGDPRITPLGRRLRRLGLDELPQLLNVIRGEMSLVGPRPERPELAERFKTIGLSYDERLAVLPGLAALSHVWGDGYTPPRHRLRLDRIYMRHMGPAFDTYILFRVALIVIRRCLVR